MIVLKFLQRFVLLWIFLVVSCGYTDEELLSLYLTWQHSPQSTMSIQWITDQKDEKDLIEYQMDGEGYWHQAKGQHHAMPMQQPYTIHYVELQQLQPASTYLFRMHKEGNVYKFRTMPTDLSSPIRFAVGGDMYNGPVDLLEKTNKAAAAKDPLFVLIGGDIAYGAVGTFKKTENPQKWIDWLKVWKQTMITPEGYLIPIIPAIGNHEVRGGSGKTYREAEFFYALFPTPGLRGYNVLDFGDYMSLILLDSGHTNPIPGPQTQWLEQTLKQRTEVPHKFAIYHIPAYPSYRNYNAKASRLIRQHWVPLFEQYGLHVAFENNDHTYKRSPLILRGRARSQGVLYLGDGSWAVENVRKPKTSKQAWYIAKSAATRYFMVVTLEKECRRFQAITPEDVIFDEF